MLRLPAWYRNTRKQLVKTPKLQFIDSGLTCNLLGIRTPGELVGHPLRGAIFESWLAVELYKQRAHRGLIPRSHHWRETRGIEVDIVVDDGAIIWLVEAKSGATVASDWFANLGRAVEQTRAARPNVEVRGVIVYGGDEATSRHGVDVVPWHAVSSLAPA